MAIRKEQVLVLLTLGVGALVARSLLQEGVRASTYTPKVLEHAAAPVPSLPLVTEPAPALARRDLCTEPSETRPLPPRELEFPPRAPLSLAGLPLDPGPDFGHLWAVRLDGGVVEGVTLTAPGEAAPPPANGGEGPPVAPTRADKEARAAKTYDRIWEVGKKAPFYGTIENPELDLFALEGPGRDFTGIEIRFRPYSVDTGKVGSIDVYGKDERKIERIELAGTLRNEVLRAVHRVPKLPSHLVELRQLIEWLLEKAREATWIYDTALEQAVAYGQLTKGHIDGLRLQQRVLQARGDLAGEWALLDGLAGEHRESAFRYEGLGVLKARLGLHKDAEADLVKAVELAPTDARPHTALAEFLQRRGRTREALASARRVEQTFGSLLDATDRARAVRAMVACRLAVADVDGARGALQMLPADQVPPYLEACVAYAAGQPAVALGKFRQAGGSADSGAALLGQGACLLREAQWQEAQDVLLKVVEQEPLLRHRGAQGLALLFVRLGQFDAAMVWLDRAIEADPQDPYSHYLRGRLLRLQGQLPGAVEALAAALRARDDFVHAIAEMAAVQAQRASEGRGDEQAQAAVAARRYGDRAVELVHAPSVELYELQGLHAFLAADPRAAATAFTAARDLAASDDGKLFAKGSLAIVDYSRGLVDDAATALQRMLELPKEAPMRAWADRTLAGIDDHAQKELLEDGFDRPEVGTVWVGEKDGQLGAQALDNALVFRGKLSRTGAGQVFVERVGAVPKAKNFLAVGCAMTLGSNQPRADAFAGLRIEMQRGAGSVECRAQLGVRDGKPFLRIEDGRSGGQEDVVQPAVDVSGFDLGGKHELELRVVPRGDPQQSKTFTLQARWNGALVAQHELKTLTANTQTELKTALFAAGPKGGDVDVRFDDYRLERRKDR